MPREARHWQSKSVPRQQCRSSCSEEALEALVAFLHNILASTHVCFNLTLPKALLGFATQHRDAFRLSAAPRAAVPRAR